MSTTTNIEDLFKKRGIVAEKVAVLEDDIVANEESIKDYVFEQPETEAIEAPKEEEAPKPLTKAQKAKAAKEAKK